MTSWSPQQEAALKAVSRWIKDKKANQVFRLFGYAGTGKTTLAREFREQVKGRVKFGAFTGKAALVLRSKGCVGASTIHSMIYKLQDEIGGQPRFVLDKDAPVKDAKLVIIDECSMVDEELGRDLLSFGVKVLVLGDPAQLPPVKGAGFFTNASPDIMLTEVHRQARENPIIHLSMKVRSGDRLDYGGFGDSRIVSREDISADDVIAHDQVLVGLNKTRRMYNDRIRQIKGKDSGLPLPGDRLVCLRNNREKGLLNGGIWSVGDVLKMRRNAIEMRLLPEDAGVTKADVLAQVHPYFFEGREGELAREVRRESDEFDYGYALTVHKSQGSQWGSVMLFDQSQVFREDARRHLYTGLTRAAERITVVM
ncbi:AAA family ATPase [Bradyrhizobium sp. Leo121]|uniref:ATP-dependent DNA helicase n=1 Tax=Bradyrhizobium sp. Leo121 TaxID=1571195 RepID=UPI0010295FCA|nr:AAA family ATPase [Bradyrhizobium sp. Leo121]RZN30473.1 ATP-binding protein [Bradyrhizobium sp. Leo121]